VEEVLEYLLARLKGELTPLAGKKGQGQAGAGR